MKSLISSKRRMDKIRYLKINPQYINFTNGHKMPDDAFVIPMAPFANIMHESAEPTYILLRSTSLFDSDPISEVITRTCGIGPFHADSGLKATCSCITASGSTPTGFLRDAIENSSAINLVNSSACGDAGTISKKSVHGKRITEFLKNILRSISGEYVGASYDQNHTCPLLFAALARHFYIHDKK